MSLESYFKIDHRVGKLLSVEVFDNISKFHSNEMACRQLKVSMYLRKRVIIVVFVFAI